MVEEVYIALLDLNSALNRRILDWEELLDLDQTGNPVYPNRGQPEYRYSPGAEDFSNKTRIMEEVLSQSEEALKTFFMSLPAADQVTVSRAAKTLFLKNPADWLAGYHNPGQNNDQEEEQDKEEDQEGAKENTVINGEDNGDCQEGLQDTEDHGYIPTPPRSPRNSIESSKSVRIRERNYQSQKQRINNLLTELKADPDKNHSKHLEKQATLLSTMLKDLDLTGIISLADT